MLVWVGHPFTPGFGRRPPVLAGREGLLASAAAALAAGPSHEAFIRLMAGPRGAGKTALLNEIEQEAAASGWRVVSVDANVNPRTEDSVLAMIEEACLNHLQDIYPDARRRLTGFNPTRLVGVTWENLPARKRSLRETLEVLADTTTVEGGAGLLVTVDEFHNLTEEQASSLSSSLQRITQRSDKRLAFIGTGLAQMRHTLLTRPGFTFFGRCHRDEVGHLSLTDAMDAIGQPLSDSGVQIAHAELRRAASATRGLAYAIQSVGAHIWNACGGPPGPVTSEHIDTAVTLMETDVAAKVVTPIWARLSPADKRFLFAMLPDTANTSLVSLARRLGKPSAHVHTYKRRLLNEGVITETPLGDLAFTSLAVRYRAVQEEALEAAAVEESERQAQQTHLLVDKPTALTHTDDGDDSGDSDDGDSDDGDSDDGDDGDDGDDSGDSDDGDDGGDDGDSGDSDDSDGDDSGDSDDGDDGDDDDDDDDNGNAETRQRASQARPGRSGP